MAFGAALQGTLYVALRIVAIGNVGDAQRPELTVGCGARQAAEVLQAERLEADPAVIQRHRLDRPHQRL